MLCPSEGWEGRDNIVIKIPNAFFIELVSRSDKQSHPPVAIAFILQQIKTKLSATAAHFFLAVTDWP